MDTKEPQQGTTYILRPDTVVELPDTENTYNRFVRIYDRLGQYITDLDLEAFNRGFVEFDEVAIRKQIAEIIYGCVEDGSDGGQIDDAVEDILDVTLGRKQ
jgi:hypothetical protein